MRDIGTRILDEIDEQWSTIECMAMSVATASEVAHCRIVSEHVTATTGEKSYLQEEASETERCIF